jgi:hypothetical protein
MIDITPKGVAVRLPADNKALKFYPAVMNLNTLYPANPPSLLIFAARQQQLLPVEI